jgi:hypothetical protein
VVQHSTRNPTTEGLNPASVTKREKIAGKVESLPFLKVHLHFEEVTVNADHKVLIEVDDSSVPIVGNPQGILDQ